jgi:hypothetical protein
MAKRLKPIPTIAAELKAHKGILTPEVKQRLADWWYEVTLYEHFGRIYVRDSFDTMVDTSDNHQAVKDLPEGVQQELWTIMEERWKTHKEGGILKELDELAERVRGSGVYIEDWYNDGWRTALGLPPEE